MGEADRHQHVTGDAMHDEHAFTDENLPAFVLGALDEEESVHIIQAHLQRCPRCQQAHRSYEEVAAALAYSVPLYEPPPHLRHMLRVVTAPAPATSARPFDSSPAGSLDWPWLGRSIRYAAVLLLLVTVGLLAWNFRLTAQVNALQNENADAHEVAEILAEYIHNPTDFEYYVFQGQTASQAPRAVVVAHRSKSRLAVVMEDMPLEMGVVYMIWLVDGEGRRILGRKVRCDREGRAVVILSLSIPLETIRGIRVMPAGREDTHPVLDGELKGNESFPFYLASTAL